MSVLVTGGAGYIGSHTVRALLEANVRAVVLDDLRAGHAEAVSGAPLVVGDVADQALVRRVVEEHAVDAVIHFAGSTAVGESVRDPRLYFRNNSLGTVALLDALLASNVRTFVFSSTCAIYGVAQTPTLAEDHPKNPVSPYGDSKLFVERVLAAYAVYGLRYRALRYFNAAGAHEDGTIGEDHDPETHLVPLAIEAALGKRGPLTIFGDDWPTPDGTPIRDYVHVMDLADAHVAAVRELAAGRPSGAYNLGTGKGASVREVLSAVERVVGKKVPVIQGPRREGDAPVLVANPTRARAEIGWAPRRSDLDTIVATAARWHAR